LRIFICWLILLGSAVAAETQTAIFAGGNFWSLQYAFERVPGVTNTVAGYIGGKIANPTYEQVADGSSGHRQAVLVTFDPKRISYEKLLNAYWHNIDPLDAGGQFCDRGLPFMSAIYFSDPSQLQIAADSKMLLEADIQSMNGSSVATHIQRATPFYPAESHHQAYYRKNPLRFKFYERQCGRAQRLFDVWSR